ncbi:hypothetical protein BASA81_000084 [Batrachochytrium salamandrivorans]|nr:hypothetical protein BASA81_000084 [Batrachochytrium salamandrivorans]
MFVVVLALALVLLVSGEEYNGTLAPTLHTTDDLKLYSYFCLEKQQKLCLGISTDGDPSYNSLTPYQMQVKRREANEAKGTDYQKMRWTVDRTNGRIQLSNFTSLCVAKQFDNALTPAPVVLRPCGTVGRLEKWDLRRFLIDITEQGTITLEGWPNQCLTLMACTRTSLGNCDPNTQVAYPSNLIPDSEELRGAYLKMMPCVANSFSQSWRQTLDCALGCSPFMTQDNICDQECNTALCNWDNNACATKKPTPPTKSPTWAPSKSPTTSAPSLTPSRAPITSFPTHSPTQHPTARPSTAPTLSGPTTSPTSSKPTLSPTTSSPSAAPSTSPSRSPTATPTFAPSTQPTLLPSKSPTSMPIVAQQLTEQEDSFYTTNWWIWLLVALAACCMCAGAGYACHRRKKRQQQADKFLPVTDADLEAGAGMAAGANGKRIIDLDEIHVVEKFPEPPINRAGQQQLIDPASPVDIGRGTGGGGIDEDYLLVDSGVKKGSSVINGSGTARRSTLEAIPIIFAEKEGLSPPPHDPAQDLALL